MFILGAGTSTPAVHYSQRECWDALVGSAEFSRLTRRSQAILKKVLLGQNGVSGRYLALDPLSEAFELNPDALQRRFSIHAPQLATTAARRAVSGLALEPGEIDALIVSTCTGYLCPGLTSYVSEQLGLRSDAILLDLVGQGCGAALPNLSTGEALLRAGRCGKVLHVCVEVCSAAFYLDDDPGVLISACLFGDGAGAVVTSTEPMPSCPQIEWIDFETRLAVKDREYLRFDHQGGMLRNILAPEVPGKASRHATDVLQTALQRNGLEISDLAGWITHAGGREVLNALSSELGVSAEVFQHSWEVLDEHGNLSSPFVFFVLQRAINAGLTPGWWWLNSFGAGFTSHGALLKVTRPR